MRWGVCLAASIFLTVWQSPAAGTAPGLAAEDHAVIARNLAENILGKGMVRSSRMANGGRSVVMVWESATYKPANPLAHTRELLLVEVQLTSGAIFRVLPAVQDVQFDIVLTKRSLATGAVGRGQPVRITYARDLGG